MPTTADIPCDEPQPAAKREPLRLRLSEIVQRDGVSISAPAKASQQHRTTLKRVLTPLPA